MFTEGLVRFDETQGFRGAVTRVELAGDWGVKLGEVKALGDVAPCFLHDGPPLLAEIRVRATRVRDRRAPSPGQNIQCVSLAFTSRS